MISSNLATGTRGKRRFTSSPADCRQADLRRQNGLNRLPFASLGPGEHVLARRRGALSAPDATAFGQIFWYTVETSPTEPMELSKLWALNKFYMAPQVNAAPGVSDVAIVLECARPWRRVAAARNPHVGLTMQRRQAADDFGLGNGGFELSGDFHVAAPDWSCATIEYGLTGRQFAARLDVARHFLHLEERRLE